MSRWILTEVEQEKYVLVPLAQGLVVGDAQPVTMDVEIGAVVAWDQQHADEEADDQ